MKPNIRDGKSLVPIVTAIISTMLLFAILAGAWMTGFSQPDTHNHMTNWALGIIDRSEYPDIFQFSDDILNGSCGAMNDEDLIAPGRIPLGYIHLYPQNDNLRQENADFRYTNLSKAKWEGITGYKGVFQLYNEYYFSGERNAYWLIGNIAHLTEDMSSPAHSYRHPHGRPSDPSHLFDHMETYFVPLIIDNIPSLGAASAYSNTGSNPWDYPELSRAAEINYCENVNPLGCGHYFTPGLYDSFPKNPDDASAEEITFAIESLKIGVN